MARNNSDSAWKDILDAYLKQCIDYCFPQLSELIDWKQSWISLDKEMQSITKKSTPDKSLLDKLFKAYLKEGGEQWILIHVEIQAEYDDDFAKRIFTYAYRIFDKYQKIVASCAVLTDARLNWRPNSYKIGIAGSFLSSEFLVVKLLDFKNRRAMLEASLNPFDCVILAQLSALEIKNKPAKERMRVKYALTKQLYEKNYTNEQIRNLYRFIDYLIGLPEVFEIEYIREVYHLEEEKNMTYVCTAERLGIKKGREMGKVEGRLEGIDEGIKRGMKKVALILLKKGFDVNEVINETGLTLVQIKALNEKESVSS